MNEDTDGERSNEAHDGVFGKLPASRPGSRSPRRRDAGAPGDAASAKPRPAAAKPRPAAAKPEPAAAKPEPAGRPAPASTPPRETAAGAEPDPQRSSGIEDLAWAGIAVAAEAATLGVRLASRAMGAVRDGVDRR